MRQSRAGNSDELLTVGDAAVVLTPCHFVGVGAQITAGDVVVNADLGAADAAEKALRHVRASAAQE